MLTTKYPTIQITGSTLIVLVSLVHTYKRKPFRCNLCVQALDDHLFQDLKKEAKKRWKKLNLGRRMHDIKRLGKSRREGGGGGGDGGGGTGLLAMIKAGAEAEAGGPKAPPATRDENAAAAETGLLAMIGDIEW